MKEEVNNFVTDWNKVDTQQKKKMLQNLMDSGNSEFVVSVYKLLYKEIVKVLGAKK
jgi:hypothetical protein